MNGFTLDLFPVTMVPSQSDRRDEPLTPGAWLQHGFALGVQAGLLEALQRIVALAPFRHMKTPGGQTMAVAMTNCGALGWVSDRRGYRYEPRDSLSGNPWPSMPPVFATLAATAAQAAGFERFEPDACLINCYRPGARLTLHQDKDERDFSAPIVSVSLGLPAVFLFGGDTRAEKQMKVPLEHGDVVVWGGAARLRYHGVTQLKDGHHPTLGAQRINLTFRRAG